MTPKALKARRTKFYAANVPRYVRVYDNGGETRDRYTVVYTGRYRHKTGGVFWYLGMSGSPYHPQGFGQHGESERQIDTAPGAWGGPAMGRRCHLGKRIPFGDLPKDCQTAALDTYDDLNDLAQPDPPRPAADPYADDRHPDGSLPLR